MKIYIYLLIILIFCNGLILANQIRSNSEKEEDIQKLKLILKELSKNIYLQKIDLILPLIHEDVGLSIADHTITKKRFTKNYRNILYEPIKSTTLSVCKSRTIDFGLSPYGMYDMYGDNLIMHAKADSDIKNSYNVAFLKGTKKRDKYKDYKCDFFMLPMTFEKIDGKFYWTWLQ